MLLNNFVSIFAISSTLIFMQQNNKNKNLRLSSGTILFYLCFKIIRHCYSQKNILSFTFTLERPTLTEGTPPTGPDSTSGKLALILQINLSPLYDKVMATFPSIFIQSKHYYARRHNDSDCITLECKLVLNLTLIFSLNV